MNEFKLHPANNFIWNQLEFTKFLVENQNQLIIIDVLDGACLETIGVYQLLDQFQFKSVIIKTPNPLESHSRYRIECIRPWMYFKTEKNNYLDYHRWNRQFAFGFFYNRPMWYRIGLASYLQTHYQDITQINIRCDPKNQDQRQLFEVQELFNYHPQSFQEFCNVMHTWPICIEDQDGYTMGDTTTAYVDQLSQFYINFLIEIVSETWVSGRVFSLTEKTIRPMLMKKPFIVMGSKDCLDYLHQMGFYTFNEFWDESYDGYHGVERYKRILSVIDFLSKKSMQELNDMYLEMTYQLDHNYQLLISQTYKKNVELIV